MKKQLLTFAAISTMILASCGGSNEVESDLDSLLDEIEMTDETENETVMDKDDESESNTEITDDSSSSDEWDSVLDDYESYVDDYVAIIKKQKENPADMSIMTEYQELMQKGTEWSTKMSEMSSNFGPEQLSRMQEIQAKLSEAAM
ncbi:MAG: DUF6591 domain-containing protein [Crocinitomicaceae bacterium]